MRYMIIVKANADSEADVMPTTETIEAMGRFNEELIAAGVLLAAEGIRSSRYGMRVRYEGGRHVAKDGPFAETKELIAGFWIIDVRGKDEALAWVRKIPMTEGEEIEVRKVFEPSDWAAEGIAPELIEREEAMRAESAKRSS